MRERNYTDRKYLSANQQILYEIKESGLNWILFVGESCLIRTCQLIVTGIYWKIIN